MKSDAGHGHAAAKQDLEPFDDLGGEARQVGQGALADLAVLALGLAQEHGGRGVAVGDGLDVHGSMIQLAKPQYKTKMSHLHGYTSAPTKIQIHKPFKGLREKWP